MAYPTPTITSSSTTFAELQAGGLSAVVERLIASNSVTGAALIATRAATTGNLQSTYNAAATSLDRWLRGDPMATNAIETALVNAQTAFMVIAEAFTEIGALVDANAGSLHPSTSGGVGTVSSTVRTWP